MNEHLKEIATVHSYDELQAVLRRRADEIAITRATIDDESGLQSGYAGKLLAPTAVKGLGRTSLGPLLSVLGLALVVVEDERAMARVRTQPKRRRPLRGA